jgi:choline dehydrogenase-like flavoprotein
MFFFCFWVLGTHSFSIDPQWEAIGAAVIGASGSVIKDYNSHVSLPHSGRGLTSWTADMNQIHRSSIRDRLEQVAANSTGKLTLMTNTLATKVLLCKSAKDVVAYGVAVAPGAQLPIAQGFAGKQKLNETRIIAKREVIVSAGAFQSPQLASFFSFFIIPLTHDQSTAHGILFFSSRLFLY